MYTIYNFKNKANNKGFSYSPNKVCLYTILKITINNNVSDKMVVDKEGDLEYDWMGNRSWQREKRRHEDGIYTCKNNYYTF